jgi:hypothetical protein
MEQEGAQSTNRCTASCTVGTLTPHLVYKIQIGSPLPLCITLLSAKKVCDAKNMCDVPSRTRTVSYSTQNNPFDRAQVLFHTTKHQLAARHQRQSSTTGQLAATDLLHRLLKHEKRFPNPNIQPL